MDKFHYMEFDRLIPRLSGGKFITEKDRYVNVYFVEFHGNELLNYWAIKPIKFSVIDEKNVARKLQISDLLKWVLTSDYMPVDFISFYGCKDRPMSNLIPHENKLYKIVIETDRIRFEDYNKTYCNLHRAVLMSVIDQSCYKRMMNERDNSVSCYIRMRKERDNDKEKLYEKTLEDELKDVQFPDIDCIEDV